MDPAIFTAYGPAHCLCEECNVAFDLHRECQLTNPIHPIWGSDNFFDGKIRNRLHRDGTYTLDGDEGLFEPLFYQDLEPAFQLATLLLERARPFHMRLMFAKLFKSRPSHTNTGAPIPNFLDETFQPTPRQEREYETILAELAQNHRFVTRVVEYGEDLVVGMATAVTITSRDLFAERAYPIYTAVNPALYDIVSNELWASQNSAARKRHFFMLANTLVHELTHLIWKDRGLRETDTLTRDKEPCVNRTHVHNPYERWGPGCELGFALEYFLFGGKFQWQKDGGYVFDNDLLSNNILWQKDPNHPHPAAPHAAVVQPESICHFFCADAWKTPSPAPIRLLLSPTHEFQMVGQLNHGFNQANRVHYRVHPTPPHGAVQPHPTVHPSQT